MLTNLYGRGDNFDFEGSHVVRALFRKCHEAKVAGRGAVTIWGTGNPRREFLHVDDSADACVFLMEHYESDEHVNVGTGEDLSIRELADTVRDVVAPGLELEFDATKHGSVRKLLDVSQLQALGSRQRIGPGAGIGSAYDWLLEALEGGTVRGWSSEPARAIRA